MTTDLIEHPPHYTRISIESIDLMEQAEGLSAVASFCICNCWKYLYRHKAKGHDVEDIKKLIWYAQKYVQIMEETNNV